MLKHLLFACVSVVAVGACAVEDLPETARSADVDVLPDPPHCVAPWGID